MSHLLGDDTPDQAIDPYLVEWVDADVGRSEGIGRAIAEGIRLVYVRESTGSAACAYLANSLAAAGRAVVSLDLNLIDAKEDPLPLAALATREARPRGCRVDRRPCRRLGRPRTRRRARPRRSPGIIALDRNPAMGPKVVTAASLVAGRSNQADHQRRSVWAGSLDGVAAVDEDAWRSLSAYRLTPEQVDLAVASARQLAAADGKALDVGELQAGARSQNAAGLEHLARRIAPKASWADLVLPDAVEVQLGEIVARVRHRPRVLDEWGMGQASARGRGITVLFSGDSGTGKTLSAEVVAHNLGLDLYVIDLSTVVDKYIGETGEEPRPDLRRGGTGQRCPVVRRGRRHLREAVRGA